MPYGRPYSTGHGYRPARYRWYPSFDSASPRRRRGNRRPHGRSHPAKTRNSRPSSSSGGFWNALDWAFRGGRFPNWYIALLEYVAIFAAIVNFPFFFLFLLKPMLEGGICVSEEEIEKDMLSSMDKISKSLRIQRKTSVEPPPGPEEIRTAGARARRALEGKLLAGTLLSNLEPVVDQSYIRDEDGTIVGRRGGIKGWLATNCPDMLPHYKALMSYKALADKLRMALGVNEPDTLAGVLNFGKMMSDGNTRDGEKTPDGTPMTGGDKTPERADAKTEKRGMTPKSLCVVSNIKLLKSSVKDVVKNVWSINAAIRRAGRSGSMASLDAVLREQLGLAWMRRGRRDRNAA